MVCDEVLSEGGKERNKSSERKTANKMIISLLASCFELQKRRPPGEP